MYVSPLGALRFGSRRYALILRYLVPISHYVPYCKKILGNYFSKVNQDLLVLACKYSSNLVRAAPENASFALVVGTS